MICAATEKGHYNSLVALQDAEYMMAVSTCYVVVFSKRHLMLLPFLVLVLMASTTS